MSSQNGTYSTMKTVFTTGEAAKICKVSQQTIIRCFDSGQLRGFRVPGSRFRRIPREALYRFMKENSIPTDALESGRRRILIVDDDQAVVDLISDVLANDARFETKVVNNGFGAGMLAKEYHPDLIILDVMLPDINGQAVCELIRQDPTMSDIKIICISGMVEEDKIAELKTAGADDFLHKPLDIDELMRRICRLLDIETGHDRLTASARRRDRRGPVEDSVWPFESSPTGRSPARCVSSTLDRSAPTTSAASSSGWTGFPCAPPPARFVLAALPDDASRRPRPTSPRPPRWRPVTDLDPGWVLARRRTGGSLDPLRLLADRPWWPPTSRRRRRGAVAALAARRRRRPGGPAAGPRGGRPRPRPRRPRRAPARAGPLGRRRGRPGVARRTGSPSPTRRERRDFELPIARNGVEHPRPEPRRALGVRPARRRRRLAARRPRHAASTRAASRPRSARPDPAGVTRWPSGPPGPCRAPSAREPGPHDPRAQAPDRRGPGPLRRALRRRRRHPARGAADPLERRLRLRLGRALDAAEASRDRFLDALSRLGPDREPGDLGRAGGPGLVRRAGSHGRAGRLARARSGGTPRPSPRPTRDPAGRPSIVPLGSEGRTGLRRGPALDGRRADAPATRSRRSIARRPGEAWARSGRRARRLAERLEPGRPRPSRRLSESEEPRLAAGEARRPGRVRRRGGSRAEQPAGRDRRPRPVAAGPRDRPQGRPLAPRDPHPGPAGPPHPPRPDVRRPPARAPAPLLPARGDRPGLPPRRQARGRGPGRPARRRRARPRPRASGPTPTPSATSPRSCSATPWRRPPRGTSPVRRPAATGRSTSLDRSRTTAAGSRRPRAMHLFDPFYCGRQAGRGLGLGLPRAARFVAAGRRRDPLAFDARLRGRRSTSAFPSSEPPKPLDRRRPRPAWPKSDRPLPDLGNPCLR